MYCSRTCHWGCAMPLPWGPSAWWDLPRWSILRPAVGSDRMIEESGRVRIPDAGTIAMVKPGKVRVLPAVHEVLPDSVRFAGGAVHPFEAIVFATGYTPSLGNLIEGSGKIADSRGRPHRFGEETGIAGLYFVGFKNLPTGALREIALEAPRVARSICAIVGASVAMDAASATTAV